MRARGFVVTAALVVLACGALAVAAKAAWPSASLGAPDGALARIALPALAGRLVALDVTTANGRTVPVRLQQGTVVPRHRLGSAQSLTVDVTVKRPGWAAWLVGSTERRSFTITTPSARLLGRWLEVKAGAPVTVAFDRPVSLVSLGDATPRRLATPQTVVPLGVIERGPHSAGTMAVAAAARPWERLPPAVRVSWFPAHPYPQLLAVPGAGARLAPQGRLTLTLSRPIAAVLGTRRPRLSPALPGRWRVVDGHTLAFQPGGLGFELGSEVRVVLPLAVWLVGRSGTSLTRVLQWQVPPATTLRLQQLLAQLGYLPLGWLPLTNPGPSSTSEQLAAAVSPPPGRFVWRYPNTPPELRLALEAPASRTRSRAAPS